MNLEPGLPHLVIVAGALVATVTGYGFIVVTAPLLAWLLPPHQVVPLTITLSTILLRPSIWREVDWRLTLRLTGAGTLGIPLGIAVLASVSADALRVIIGAAVVAAALLSLLTRARPPSAASGVPDRVAEGAPGPTGRAGILSSLIAGFTGGVLSGCIGMNGPPVALYLTAARVPKETFRATALATVWLLSLVTLAQLAVVGQLALDLSGTLPLLPATIAGSVLGFWVFRRLSSARFRALSLSMAATAGAITVLGAFVR